MSDRDRDDDPDALWVFGYGSLVWRPAFPFAERRAGSVRGWTRRLWQGSTDHRGTPGAPGRVATLVRRAEAMCWGTAYRVAPEHRHEVLARLDVREQGGYDRHQLHATLIDGRAVQSLVYVATEDNPNYLGPAPLEAIAAQVRRSVGPSGPNIEYVLELAEALEHMDALDEHVGELAALLR